MGVDFFFAPGGCFGGLAKSVDPSLEFNVFKFIK